MDENDEVIIKTGDKSKYEDGTKVVITEINKYFRKKTSSRSWLTLRIFSKKYLESKMKKSNHTLYMNCFIPLIRVHQLMSPYQIFILQ